MVRGKPTKSSGIVLEKSEDHKGDSTVHVPVGEGTTVTLNEGDVCRVRGTIKFNHVPKSEGGVNPCCFLTITSIDLVEPASPPPDTQVEDTAVEIPGSDDEDADDADDEGNKEAEYEPVSPPPPPAKKAKKSGGK